MDRIDMILESENETIIELVDLIGAEHTWKLVEMFGGSQFYLPMPENIAREYRNSKIYKDYKNGMGYKALKTKYRLSEMTIRRIIKSEMEKRKAVKK